MIKWDKSFEMDYVNNTSLTELVQRAVQFAGIFEVDTVVTRHSGRDDVSMLEIGPGPSGGLMGTLSYGERRVYVDPLMDEYVKINPKLKEMSTEQVVGYAHELPFGDCEFDVVFCIEVLDHCEDEDQYKQAIGELYRVLDNGGICFFMVPARSKGPHYGHPCNYPSVVVNEMFKEHGFEVLRHNFGREGVWFLARKPDDENSSVLVQAPLGP